jgi:hypothetical protein
MATKNLNSILVGPGDTSDFEVSRNFVLPRSYALSLGALGDMRMGVYSGIAAAGSSTTDATVISHTAVLVGTAAASTGVRFKDFPAGARRYVWNYGANAISVYPPTDGTINFSAANGAYALASTFGAVFVGIATNTVLAFKHK